MRTLLNLVLRLSLVGLTGFVVPAVAEAQTGLASVTGIVSDQSGAAIPGLSVTATNQATTIVYVGVTNQAGNYIITGVPIGDYVIAAERAPGFTVLPIPESFPHMSSQWLRVGPETAYWLPRLAAKIWNLDTIYISENGTSGIDQLAPDGNIYDLDRIMYLRNYLAQLQRATAEGVPVRGYFLWSLIDNFEWSFGFEKRFGLYRVDFKTQLRTPKLSASFYRNVIARNAVDT